MKKTKLQHFLIFFIILLCVIVLPITFSKYIENFNVKITLNVRKPAYTVKFFSNRNDGNPDEVSSQSFVYGTSQNLNKNNYTNGSLYFTEWNTSANGSGTSYNDEQEVNNLSSVDNSEVNLYAQWVSGVARIGNTYYTKLQSALDAVPKNGTETTVELLANVNENLKILKNQNVRLELRNHTVSITTGSIMDNSGTVNVINGILTSSSTSDGAINNQSTGRLIINGSQVLMTVKKGKQAIYNNAGIVEIKSSSYLYSASDPALNSNVRATLQNQASGTVVITGGTIVSESYQAINNIGTMTIGVKDDSVDKTNPIIQGATIGLNIANAATCNFYDGIIKGYEQAVNNENKVVDVETGYNIVHSAQEIDNKIYKTVYLALTTNTTTVSFNANGGTTSESTRTVETGTALGYFPTVSKSGQVLTGWYTLDEEPITESTIITSDVAFIANWESFNVAEVSGVQYSTLQKAINAVPTNNTKTVVKLLRSTSENVLVKLNQNVEFNLQNFTLSNSGNDPLIDNSGTIEIYNGTYTSNGTSSVINNNATGRTLVRGGRIIATGTRQCIYNYGNGIVEITDNAYLVSSATDAQANASIERATVQNLVNGIVNITGGKIVGLNQQAISNEGTLTLGTSGGGIDISSPEIIGHTYGIKSIGTISFYDGIVKGIDGGFSGTISNQEANTQISSGTDTIDNETYITEYLEEL